MIWQIWSWVNHSIYYPNLTMKSLDSFILASRYNWVSCNQTLSYLGLHGNSRVSRVQPPINAYEILLQYDWLLFFSRHNRFAETYSYLQLSYQLTDRFWRPVIIQVPIGILSSQDPPLFMSNGWGNKRVAQEWIFDPWLVKLSQNLFYGYLSL